MNKNIETRSNVYEAVSPLGGVVTKVVPLAPRLESLENKTVCEIWNEGFRADETFPMLREMLLERYPTVKVIPYTEIPSTSIASWGPQIKAKTREALRTALKEKGCDAVISGNGG